MSLLVEEKILEGFGEWGSPSVAELHRVRKLPPVTGLRWPHLSLDLWHFTGCSQKALVVSEVHLWGIKWLFQVIPGSNFSFPSQAGWLGPLWSFLSPRVSSESFHWTDDIRPRPHTLHRLSLWEQLLFSFRALVHPRLLPRLLVSPGNGLSFRNLSLIDCPL